jgi:galactokinase
MIEQVLAPQATSVVFNRCRYVVEENERLVSGCLLLEKNDIEGFGKKMFGSHAGLRDLYEVSCAELDLLVDLAIAEPAIAGARMMGGGFGGCTINLIREDSIDAIYQRFRNIYREHTGLDLKVYITTPQEGARKVDFGS